jgi:starch-binding outer membrane protein, SusD/RagB family
MRRFIILFFVLSTLAFTSCTDLFETDPDNITNVDDYISTNDEMYKGFLGILTKMQQAGDQAIFLTDTRCDFLEVTNNAPVELQDIYNYNDTKGNSYADPTCYYAVIMACNDFINKMKEYRARVGESMDDDAQTNFNALISSTLRTKVWAYYTLGRIYGKAVWFDEPLNDLKNLNDSTTFVQLNSMSSIVNKCLNLLDNGIIVYNNEHITADLTMDWAAWLDPESEDEDAYRKWNYLTPEWLLLRCELASWRGEQSDWQWIHDEILLQLYTVQTKTADTYIVYPGYMYACNIPETFSYYTQFFTEEIGDPYQFISGIMYDYDNDQTNRLVDYFCPTYPSSYYLRPSSYAIGKYIEGDIRSLTQKLCMDVINGDTCFTKNYYHRGSFLKTDIFKIMPMITLQRGHDYHFLLAEAENHLGHWEQAECILNQGVNNAYTYASYLPDSTWSTYYSSWFGDNGGYGDVGIAGCVRGASHSLPKPTDSDYSITEEERIRLYDMALADEYLLEYTGEGKAYSYLIKMALRYPEYGASIIADRVVPKYPVAKQAAVRAAIESGGYWVDWDLNGDNE